MAGSGVLGALQARLDNTLVARLEPDPAEQQQWPNRVSRPQRSGHFVRSAPTPLREPYLIAVSDDMVARLGLSAAQARSAEFVRLFSGDVRLDGSGTERGVPGLDAWCTPYAVSVYGHPIPSPDQFGGYGYGDGRAVSIGEFRDCVDERARWELQLKGSGPSPFSRRFDGRAVLRSSVREFLVSEAMHWLGVPTTRALCLVGSGADTVARAWYRPGAEERVPEGDEYPPDHMVSERCAISTRAASSFLRVGQVELYARRLARGDPGARQSMAKFVRYCIEREFPDVACQHLQLQQLQQQQLLLQQQDGALPPAAVLAMLREFAKRQARLVAAWLRVGYVQGNMNSDNCLLAGLTMDYGPFGWMEQYDPLWTPFTSDPERKFGFERQPLAHAVNLATLAEALQPLLGPDADSGAAAWSPDAAAASSASAAAALDLREEAIAIVRGAYGDELREATNEVYAAKLGLSEFDERRREQLWEPLFKVLPGLDYTVFFRELSSLSSETLGGAAARLGGGGSEEADQALASLMRRAAYDWPLLPAPRKRLADWLRVYAEELAREQRPDAERLAAMRRANPKYVPREWMLVEAYEAAERKNYGPLQRLQRVFREPYAEHGPEEHEAFYRTTPEEYRRKPGCSFFSCSS